MEYQILEIYKISKIYLISQTNTLSLVSSLNINAWLITADIHETLRTDKVIKDRRKKAIRTKKDEEISK